MYVAEDSDYTFTLRDQSAAAHLKHMLDSNSGNCLRCAFGKPCCTADNSHVTHATGDRISGMPESRMM